MEFREVYERYRPALKRVEALMHEAVQSKNKTLTDASTRLLEAGGKRIRPLFAVICSRLGESNPEEACILAAALELIHMATLVHDDVIDDAMLRRGHPTVRSTWGNRPAMYTGDFLFARAIELLCGIESARVHREMSGAIVRMTEGEIEQIRDFYYWDQSYRNYLRRVERKTALLISVSCMLGTYLASQPEDVVIAMKRFGYYTGMAFQIIDDVLDFVGDAAIVGKPVGGDLRQGNITLPALIAAKHGHLNQLSALVQRDTDELSIDEAIKLIRATNALELSRNYADLYLEKAIAQLGQIKDELIREELKSVALFVNQRTF